MFDLIDANSVRGSLGVPKDTALGKALVKIIQIAVATKVNGALALQKVRDDVDTARILAKRAPTKHWLALADTELLKSVDTSTWAAVKQCYLGGAPTSEIESSDSDPFDNFDSDDHQGLEYNSANSSSVSDGSDASSGEDDVCSTQTLTVEDVTTACQEEDDIRSLSSETAFCFSEQHELVPLSARGDDDLVNLLCDDCGFLSAHSTFYRCNHDTGPCFGKDYCEECYLRSVNFH